MILCDTNVFIHAFNQHQPTIDSLASIGFDNIVLSSVSVMELYRGMCNKAELLAMRRKLIFYDVIQITTETSKKAIELMAIFKLSHDLRIPDALNGATAVVTGIPSFTYNTKDFAFMPGIVLHDF
ncbi:hypothetical protein BH09BAC4_BH09BAC4_23830 [soil metagenome]